MGGITRNSGNSHINNSNNNSNNASHLDDDDSEEDLSDEAMVARHDTVLRNMREKWALMQQLKMETRKGGPGGEYSHHKKLSGGGVGFGSMGLGNLLEGGSVGGPYAGSGSHMKYRKYQNGNTEVGFVGGSPLVTGGVLLGGGGGVGSSALSSKKRGYSDVVNGSANSMKRRGRPPKFVKSTHASSQRGNNQYTAIRAAAAAASALSHTTNNSNSVGHSHQSLHHQLQQQLQDYTSGDQDDQLVSLSTESGSDEGSGRTRSGGGSRGGSSD